MPGIGSTACKAEPGSTHSNNHTLRKWQRCRPSPRRRTRCSCGPGPPRSARQGGQLPDDAGHGLAARRLPLLRAARRGGDHLCTRTRPCPVLGRVVSAARPQALPQAPPRPGPSVPGAAHVCGPLPLPQPSQACLGQQAVVPVDVVGVEPQLALLGVLLDGGAGLVLLSDGFVQGGCLWVLFGSWFVGSWFDSSRFFNMQASEVTMCSCIRHSASGGRRKPSATSCHDMTASPSQPCDVVILHNPRHAD